jgi:hypothetical protein
MTAYGAFCYGYVAVAHTFPGPLGHDSAAVELALSVSQAV